MYADSAKNLLPLRSVKIQYMRKKLQLIAEIENRDKPKDQRLNMILVWHQVLYNFFTISSFADMPSSSAITGGASTDHHQTDNSAVVDSPSQSPVGSTDEHAAMMGLAALADIIQVLSRGGCRPLYRAAPASGEAAARPGAARPGAVVGSAALVQQPGQHQHPSWIFILVQTRL